MLIKTRSKFFQKWYYFSGNMGQHFVHRTNYISHEHIGWLNCRQSLNFCTEIIWMLVAMCGYCRLFTCIIIEHIVFEKMIGNQKLLDTYLHTCPLLNWTPLTIIKFHDVVHTSSVNTSRLPTISSPCVIIIWAFIPQ